MRKKTSKNQPSRMLIIAIFAVVLIALVPIITHLMRPNFDVEWLPTTGTQILTNAEMDAILNDDRRDVGVFVYIGMAGCPACVQFEPTLHTTLAEHGLGLRHFQIEDARAENEEVAGEILATISRRARRTWEGGVPVIKLFVGGEIVDYLVGIQSQADITRFFERHGGLE